ncbi:unnamed protein product [Camellia sinensis]
MASGHLSPPLYPFSLSFSSVIFRSISFRSFAFHLPPPCDVCFSFWWVYSLSFSTLPSLCLTPVVALPRPAAVYLLCASRRHRQHHIDPNSATSRRICCLHTPTSSVLAYRSLCTSPWWKCANPLVLRLSFGLFVMFFWFGFAYGIHKCLMMLCCIL